MLASFDDAEEAVQETMLRGVAQPRTGSSPTGTSGRGCYRIATNVCLDLLRRRSRRASVRSSTFVEVPWLQPYPDRLLDELAAPGDEPDVVVVDRETIELAFLAALQLLPPRQRAAWLLRDLLGWTANETAELLETSVAAANSALQRARATMQSTSPAGAGRVVDGRAQRRGPGAARAVHRRARALRRRGRDRHRRARTSASPCRPYPYLLRGPRRGRGAPASAASGRERDGDWRLLPTWANRMPAAG